MSVVIIQQDGNYYYQYGDQIYVLNEETFDRFKDKLVSPLEISFKNCTMAFVGYIIQSIFEGPVDVQVKRVKSTALNTGDYEAVVSKSKGRTL